MSPISGLFCVLRFDPYYRKQCLWLALCGLSIAPTSFPTEMMSEVDTKPPKKLQSAHILPPGLDSLRRWCSHQSMLNRHESRWPVLCPEVQLVHQGSLCVQLFPFGPIWKGQDLSSKLDSWFETYLVKNQLSLCNEKIVRCAHLPRCSTFNKRKVTQINLGLASFIRYALRKYHTSTH